ncbi:discoidin domain-containing protein [Pseudoflavitalea sp. G-6-1-2]|uniref:discoidin domain-containing protein n=1 Tax=Pseudoflavitalea sp. G-6-1-2 TaxID=2728841 RepID=UPI00198242DD|nr:discoidin domain-containing protein [Pseudoflavitalea sp. G-6-1-2]
MKVQSLSAPPALYLRGEGNGIDGTVLDATQKSQHTLIVLQGSGSGYGEIAGTKARITQNYVATGDKSFEVAAGHTFAPGDNVVIQRTPNDAWITLLDMAQYGWAASGYKTTFERKITAVNGNTITIDIPVMDPMEIQYGGGEVFKSNITGRIAESGVENMRLESDFEGDSDENHGWNGIQFNRAENCWVRDVVVKYFGYAAVSLSNMSRFNTVQDCAMIDPKSVTTGGRKYSFNLEGNATSNLFQRCITWGGRHDYVSGSKVPGPNVFLDCVSENTQSDIGPHHRWATGQLYDNIYGGQIQVQNRKAMGSGHGWAGAQIMFWNLQSTKSGIKVESPAAAMNWGIGCIGTAKNGTGYWESWGTHLLPRSLYLQQLEERLGAAAVQNIATADQLNNTLRALLRTRIAQIANEAKVYLPEIPGGNTAAFDITDNGGVVTAQFVSNRPLENFPNIIDNDINTKYYQNGKKALWVQYRSTVPAIVTRYTITSANDVEERDPKDWNLQGSNNGTSWTTIDTRTNEDFPTRLLTRTFEISNTTAYRYYRLNILSNGNNNNTQFAEWELWQRKLQTISFGDIPAITFGDDPVELTVSSSSALPVTLEVVSGNATVNEEGILTVNGAGEIVLRATQAGDTNYFPAAPVERIIAVEKATQTVTFEPISDRTYGDAAFTPQAASDAHLPVTIEVVSGSVSLNAEGLLSINGAGGVTLKASQAGNENYLAASAEISFNIAKAAQQINFPYISSQLRTATLTPGATASSGLPVSYFVASGPASVWGDAIRFNGEGEVVLKAVQPGNENYLAADTADRRFIVYGTESKTEKFKLVIAPNPTRGPLTVLILNKMRDKQYTFRLCDQNGRVISSCIIAGNSLVSVAHFNLFNQPNGTYYLYATNGEEQLVRIIVKQ